MQAVLTGTLTGPATERSADFSMAALAEAAGELIAWGMANPRFMRFRGTSWQMYLSDGSRALRVSLFLAACLRAAETGMGTRVAAAVGAVERLDDNLGRAAGPAFDASGQALDRMPRGRWLRVVAAGPDPWAGASEALALALDPAAPPQGDIAARLGVTRQAVQARLSAAGLPALLPALAAFEAAETVGITLPSP
jgi:hypothetical protein